MGYRFDSTIVSVFKTKSGKTRVVAETDEGLLHIFSEENLASGNDLTPKKCCLETVKQFIKETEVTVGDMPAFPPKAWFEDKTKPYKFTELIRKQKVEAWVKQNLGNYLKKKQNEQRERSSIRGKIKHTEK